MRRVWHACCRHEVGIALGKAGGREVGALWWRKAERHARGCGESICKGIEGRGPGIGHCRDNLGRGKEIHGLGIAVVAAAEVAIVGGKDGVVVTARYAVRAFPLSDAGTTGIGEDGAAGGGEFARCQA